MRTNHFNISCIIFFFIIISSCGEESKIDINNNSSVYLNNVDIFSYKGKIIYEFLKDIQRYESYEFNLHRNSNNNINSCWFSYYDKLIIEFYFSDSTKKQLQKLDTMNKSRILSHVLKSKIFNFRIINNDKEKYLKILFQK